METRYRQLDQEFKKIGREMSLMMEDFANECSDFITGLKEKRTIDTYEEDSARIKERLKDVRQKLDNYEYTLRHFLDFETASPIIPVLLIYMRSIDKMVRNINAYRKFLGDLEQTLTIIDQEMAYIKDHVNTQNQ